MGVAAHGPLGAEEQVVPHLDELHVVAAAVGAVAQASLQRRRGVGQRDSERKRDNEKESARKRIRERLRGRR